jgi:hypothetical protein
MSRREAWREFLQKLGARNEVVGVLVVDGEGNITGRYGQADVFSDEAIDRADAGADVEPNSQDVWMEELADRIVLVAFDRGGEVSAIERAVAEEAKRAGLGSE